MNGDPSLGVLFHWIGGLAAASFYLPYKGVRRWSWETYWLVGGLFSWIVAPPLLAMAFVPGTWDVIAHASSRTLVWTFVFGLLWGVGGLTFGLTVRYLGVALGYAVALGFCAAFGTLLPPVFEGKIADIAASTGGKITLLGVGICLVGIALSGLAGKSKEAEMSEADKRASVREFAFGKGLTIAVLCGIMSACMAFAFASGKPIGDAAAVRLAAEGRLAIWQKLPILVVVLWGGFLTNLIWCLILHVRNGSGGEYVRGTTASATTAVDAHGVATDSTAAALPVSRPVPLAANYALSALAGVTWYFQFFFYSMGETKMGDYGFSSWTLHMASIIIFSTLWGVALKEWRGSSRRTHTLIALGLATLVLSTVVVGYGTYLDTATK